MKVLKHILLPSGLVAVLFLWSTWAFSADSVAVVNG